MTKDTYKELMALLTVNDIMSMAPRLPGVKSPEELRELYPKDSEQSVMRNVNAHRIYVGELAGLFKRALFLAASPVELGHIMNQLYIAIDAVKHELNYKQAEIDNDIPTLRKRYGTHTMLRCNLPMPVLKRYAARFKED